MKYLIAEAGNDIGILLCMEMNKRGYDYVAIDRNVAPLSGIVPADRLVKESAFSIEMLDDSLFMPTSEFFVGRLFTVRNRFPDACKYLPSEYGYLLSRDKLSLYERFSGPNFFSKKWSRSTPYGKPIDGVGARGCRLYDAAPNNQDGLVFQRFLPGKEYVCDLILGTAVTRVVHAKRGSTDMDFSYVKHEQIEFKTKEIAAAFDAPILNAQFIYDENERPVLTDVGTRLSASALCNEVTGMDVFDALIEGRPPAAPSVFPNVRRYWSMVEYEG